MSKYRITANELKEHWDDQIHFINKSIKDFDNGDEKEARRIATCIRVLFNETMKSKSIYSQLNQQIHFISNTDLYTPSNLISSWTLLMMEIKDNNSYYKANLDRSSRVFLMTFEDWWNEIIFDDLINKFSRRDIILYVADQDGGAHVDPKLDESYAALIKLNSLGWVQNNDQLPGNNPAYQAVRAIANELVISLNLLNIGLKQRVIMENCEFEMRIVDDKGHRYKWSTSEITYSEETKRVVEKDRIDKRKLYLDEFKNGFKFEYIGLA